MDVKYFPLDIESVKKYGVKRWHEDFFWPILYAGDVEGEIKQIFNEIIKHGSEEARELITINYKLYIEYANLINSLMILKKLSEQAVEPLCIGGSIQFKGIIEQGVPLQRLLPIPVIENRPFLKKLIDRIRFAKRQFITNPGFAAKLNSFGKRPCYHSYYANDSEQLSTYLKQKQKSGVRLTNPACWYPSIYSSVLNSKQAKDIENFAIHLVKEIADIAIKCNVELSGLQKKFLQDLTKELFIATRICMNALERFLSSKKPINLLVGTSGNSFVRMLSTVVRKNGGTVTGFDHGEPVVYIWDIYRWLEFLTVDKFITFTKPLATTLASLKDKIPLIGNSTVQIEGAETHHFFKLWQRESQKPVPKKIEKVMIVGCPFAADNKINYGGVVHPLLLLDWTIRVVNLLREAGVKIIVKKHPGGMYQGDLSELLDPDVEIIHDRFEEVMDYADAFIFGHARTTTLGHALCTNKPIIYFHGEWERWFPEMWGLLANRCRIVDLELDEKNRLRFKEDELLEAISQTPAEPDLGFAKVFMFPQNAIL